MINVDIISSKFYSPAILFLLWSITFAFVSSRFRKAANLIAASSVAMNASKPQIQATTVAYTQQLVQQPQLAGLGDNNFQYNATMAAPAPPTYSSQPSFNISPPLSPPMSPPPTASREQPISEKVGSGNFDNPFQVVNQGSSGVEVTAQRQRTMSENLNKAALNSLATTHPAAYVFWNGNFGDGVEAVPTADFKMAVQIQNGGLDIMQLDVILKQEFVEAKVFKMLVVGNSPLSKLFAN